MGVYDEMIDEMIKKESEECPGRLFEIQAGKEAMARKNRLENMDLYHIAPLLIRKIINKEVTPPKHRWLRKSNPFFDFRSMKEELLFLYRGEDIKFRHIFKKENQLQVVINYDDICDICVIMLQILLSHLSMDEIVGKSEVRDGMIIFCLDLG